MLKHVLWAFGPLVLIALLGVTSGGFPSTPSFSSAQISNGTFLGTNLFTYGTFNSAVGCAYHANTGQAAQVNGWGAPQNIANFPSRDTVGCYMDNVGQPPVTTAAGTFTTTTFVPTVAFAAPIISQFRVGMLVDTSDATKYSGTITSWAANGTSITVSGWFQQGNTAAGQTPAGANAIINPVTNVWAINTNVYFNGSSYTGGGVQTGITGYESDVSDTSSSAATNIDTAFDAVNTNAVTDAMRAYASRGRWKVGYRAESGSIAGFQYQPTGGFAVVDGFLSSQLSGVAFHANSQTSGQFLNGNNTFTVNFLGQTDIGNQSSSAAPALFLHSSGHATGDALISSTGGTGASDGTLVFTAAAVKIGSITIPKTSYGLMVENGATCTVSGAAQSSNFASCGSGATGSGTITFNLAYATPPICTATTSGATFGIITNSVVTTASTVAVDSGLSGVATNESVFIICVGGT